MNTVETWLQNMKQQWSKEPAPSHPHHWYYLTPEERLARLRELMAPVSDDRKKKWAH